MKDNKSLTPVLVKKLKPQITKLILPSVLLLLVGSSCFYGGMSYQKLKNNSLANQQSEFIDGVSSAIGKNDIAKNNSIDDSNQNTSPNDDSKSLPVAMNRGVIGVVTAASESSINVNDQIQGAAKVFTISNATKIIENNVAVSVSDISKGDRVMILLNSANSSLVSQIEINPQSVGPKGNRGGQLRSQQRSQDDSEI